MEDIMTVDLSNVGSFMINGENGEQLIALVRKAMESHSWWSFSSMGWEENTISTSPRKPTANWCNS